MSKLVIHVFHADAPSLGTGSHVAERIRQVAADKQVQLEVFIFGPAQRALLDSSLADYNNAIDELTQKGVSVFACLNLAKELGSEAALAARRIQLAYARDKFVEYAAAGATVITF